MVRTTVGTIAEAEISVQETEAVERINANQTTTVPAGQSDTTVVTAPSGTLMSVHILKIVVDPPAGATSGSHQIVLQGPDGRVSYLLAIGDFDTSLRIDRSIILSANSLQQPSTEVAQQASIRALILDDTSGVTIQYSNDTDADQTAIRIYRLITLKKGVTS